MKKVILFIILAVTCMSYANANTAHNAEKQVTNVPDSIIQPEFPGGIPELMNYLTTNLKYPKMARDSSWEGETICDFIVDKNGSIDGVKVVQSSGYQLLDEEAIRVIQSMPKWTPGHLENGKPVRVQFRLPIKFSLE